MDGETANQNREERKNSKLWVGKKISLIIDRLNLLQGSARGNVLKAPENNGSGSRWKPKFSGLDLELIGM